MFGGGACGLILVRQALRHTMKLSVPSWLLQLVWFVASVFATGAVWYFLPRGNTAATVLSIVSAAVLAVVAVQCYQYAHPQDQTIAKRFRPSAAPPS